jgi:hypothetical protein
MSEIEGDPYTSWWEWTDRGLRVITEAVVLDGPGAAEVEAECRRRSEMWVAIAGEWLAERQVPTAGATAQRQLG